MAFPSVTICSCFIPAVVTAGVPMRMPDVMNGDLGSKGYGVAVQGDTHLVE